MIAEIKAQDLNMISIKTVRKITRAKMTKQPWYVQYD